MARVEALLHGPAALEELLDSGGERPGEVGDEGERLGR
jgi:hypothetical protein